MPTLLHLATAILLLPNAQSLAPSPILSIPSALDTLTSGLASITRLPYGVTVSSDSTTSASEGAADSITLYDLEGDADCRSVRELISELDLCVNIEPRFIGEGSVPILNVESTADDATIALELRGKDDILQFLYKTYTTSGAPAEETEAMQILNQVTPFMPSILRFGRGLKPSKCASDPSSTPRPKEPLTLYSYEGNQFCRLVREVLTELNISYEIKSAGKGSPRRAELAKISGATQCPYLIDPNTDVKMAESKDIIAYLYKTYALWTPPNETLQAASKVITPLLKPVYAYIAPLQAAGGGEEYDERATRKVIEEEISSAHVVIYTYELSPFCTEATALLGNLGIEYKEISLGKEWIPGLIAEGGAAKRAALGGMTGQTSLPHVFVNGKSVGGLFSGTPGIVPALEEGKFVSMVEETKSPSVLA